MTTCAVMESPSQDRSQVSGPKPSGVILYQGNSQLDPDANITVIAVGLARRSNNIKTGGLIQTYILTDNGLDPVAAAQTGTDYAVCGNCPLRKTSTNTCYVDLTKAPMAVWNKYKRGKYPRICRKYWKLFSGRIVRLGAYGDPAACPIEIWKELLSHCAGWRGYTRQWKQFPEFKEICMASVHTAEELHEARKLGWKTFRIRLPEEPLEADEFICPAAIEGGKVRTCETCRACSGGQRNQQATPAAIVHGLPWKEVNYRKYRISLNVLTGKEV